MSSENRFRLTVFCLLIFGSYLFEQHVPLPVPAAVALSRLWPGRPPYPCRITSTAIFLHRRENSSRQYANRRVFLCLFESPSIEVYEYRLRQVSGLRLRDCGEALLELSEALIIEILLPMSAEGRCFK